MGLGMCACLLTANAQADPVTMHLSLENLDAARHPQLRVVAGASQSVAFQVSADLRGWYTLPNRASLTNRPGTTNWEASFTDLNNGNGPGTFYRALSPQPPLDVTLQTDPRWAVSALITTNGGKALLRLPNQSTVTLTVPPLAVDVETIVRMSWVTNVVGAPAGSGPVGTILLEPEGLSFWNPVVLEFAFPTNNAQLTMRGFSCNGDGTDFHGFSSRAASNVVSLALDHFSAYDIRSISDAQLAGTVARYARSARASLEQDITTILSAERYHQLLGDQSPGATGEELAAVAGLIEQYYKRSIQPYLGAADANCVLLKFLAKETFMVLRQRALLGLEDDAFSTGAAAEFGPHFQRGMENCMNIILEKCATGQKSTEAVQELLGYARQAALLGIPTAHSLTEIFEKCGPGNWTGTLLYEENGATNDVVWDPGFSNPKKQAGTRERSFHFRIEASVESVTESFAPGYGSLLLQLAAPTTGSEWDRTEALFEPDCEGAEITHPPGQTISTSLDLVAAVTNHFQFFMFYMPGLTNLSIPLPSLNLTGRYFDLSRADSPDCRTAGATSNVSDPRTESVSAPSYSITSPAFSTQVSSNAVTVVGTGKRTQNEVVTSWFLRADFKRKP